MKRILLITMLLFTASATAGDTYLEIGAGKNGSLLKNSHEWEDQGGVGAYFALRYEFDAGWFAQITHYSQYDVGRPFDNRAESNLDSLMFGYRFKLN